MYASAWVYSAIDEHIRPGQNGQQITNDNLKTHFVWTEIIWIIIQI